MREYFRAFLWAEVLYDFIYNKITVKKITGER